MPSRSRQSSWINIRLFFKCCVVLYLLASPALVAAQRSSAPQATATATAPASAIATATGTPIQPPTLCSADCNPLIASIKSCQKSASSPPPSTDQQWNQTVSEIASCLCSGGFASPPPPTASAAEECDECLKKNPSLTKTPSTKLLEMFRKECGVDGNVEKVKLALLEIFGRVEPQGLLEASPIQGSTSTSTPTPTSSAVRSAGLDW
ncbi:hypothetical protein HK102_013551, partial [Quaeritorhiza haematococci]